MWDAIASMFGQLDQSTRTILALAVFPLGIWVFTHIRRDPQGKPYWFSQKYEDRKRLRKQDLILEKIEGVERKIEANTLEIKRLRILNLIQHNPEERVAIAKEYDAYIAMGGNSYIADIYRKYLLSTIKENT